MAKMPSGKTVTTTGAKDGQKVIVSQGRDDSSHSLPKPTYPTGDATDLSHSLGGAKAKQ